MSTAKVYKHRNADVGVDLKHTLTAQTEGVHHEASVRKDINVQQNHLSVSVLAHTHTHTREITNKKQRMRKGAVMHNQLNMFI